MAIDPRIREAIESAVEEDGQDASLSRKLVAWFEELSSGNERIDDAERHLKILYDSTTLIAEEAANAPREVELEAGIALDADGEESGNEGSPDR